MIAGLPASTAAAAAATLNNDRESPWQAMASAFPARDGGFYSAEAIKDAGLELCRFAMRDERDRDGVPTPSRIVVAYVEGDGSNQLWDVFGHAVLPLPLRDADGNWPDGRHWRHHIESVNRIVRSALDSLSDPVAEAFRLRLEAYRRDDILLLPGRNFHIGDAGRLAGRFREFMEGRLDIAGIEVGVRVEHFRFERLPGFYGRMGGSNQRFAVDARNLVFAKANVGQDGGLPHLEPEPLPDAAAMRRVLEGRYRFGTSLRPSGFQHDVQREYGERLVRERFDCVTKGVHEVTNDHANVFSSDVVTG